MNSFISTPPCVPKQHFLMVILRKSKKKERSNTRVYICPSSLFLSLYTLITIVFYCDSQFGHINKKKLQDFEIKLFKRSFSIWKEATRAVFQSLRTTRSQAKCLWSKARNWKTPCDSLVCFGSHWLKCWEIKPLSACLLSNPWRKKLSTLCQLMIASDRNDITRLQMTARLPWKVKYGENLSFLKFWIISQVLTQLWEVWVIKKIKILAKDGYKKFLTEV